MLQHPLAATPDFQHLCHLVIAEVVVGLMVYLGSTERLAWSGRLKWSSEWAAVGN